MRRLEKASKPQSNGWSHILFKLVFHRIVRELGDVSKELNLYENLRLKKLVHEVLDAELELEKKDFYKVYNSKKLK